jgi:hypothetical protein
MKLRRPACLALALVFALAACGGDDGGGDGVEDSSPATATETATPAVPVVQPDEGCTESHPTRAQFSSSVRVSMCIGDSSLRFANNSPLVLRVDSNAPAQWDPEPSSPSAPAIVQWQEDLRDQIVQPYLARGPVYVLPGQAGTVEPLGVYLQWWVQADASAAIFAIDHLIADAADRLGGPNYKLNASMVRCGQGAVRQYQATVDPSPQSAWHYALQTALTSSDCRSFADNLFKEHAATRPPTPVPEVRLTVVRRAQQFEQQSARVLRFLTKAARVGNTIR